MIRIILSEFSECGQVDWVGFWGSYNWTCAIPDLDWNSIVSTNEFGDVFDSNLKIGGLHIVQILLCILPSLIDSIWSWEHYKERKIFVLSIAGLVIVHGEADSLHREWASADWLEGSCIVVKLVDLEARANFCRRPDLSKAKLFIHMNCGSSTVYKTAEEWLHSVCNQINLDDGISAYISEFINSKRLFLNY